MVTSVGCASEFAAMSGIAWLADAGGYRTHHACSDNVLEQSGTVEHIGP